MCGKVNKGTSLADNASARVAAPIFFLASDLPTVVFCLHFVAWLAKLDLFLSVFTFLWELLARTLANIN